MSTGIEWTDETWNPVTGCDRTSPGCDHCYALKMAARLKLMGQANYQTDGDPRTSGPGFGVQCHPHMLDQPLRWKRPRRVFVNSMSDLFHPDVPDKFIARVFAIMADCQNHDFQVLTKRAQRMAALLTSKAFGVLVQRWYDIHDLDGEWSRSWESVEHAWPLPNVWLGVSIENDRYTFRADHLRETPAAVRWISAEPLLGPLPSLDLTGIDWLVVGGESGPGARPMHPDWARDLRDRCQLDQLVACPLCGDDAELVGAPGPGEPANEYDCTGCAHQFTMTVPAFLFKQWGAWVPIVGDGIEFGRWVDPTTGLTHASPGHGRVLMSRFGKHAAGRLLDGRTWDEYPAERAS